MQPYEIHLSDADLAAFNGLLPWFAGTELPHGRVLGSLSARPGKRESIQPIPDKRIARLHERIDLRGKTVLELGCFEGIHTVGLCSFGASVTAVDMRPMNVVKTNIRLAAYGMSAATYVLDVEDDRVGLPRFDVMFHCGVLYHLEDPVAHLARMLPLCDTIYLDTHVAGEDESSATLRSGDAVYQGRYHNEGGWADPFSGRGQGAFWLKRSDIEKILVASGFSVELWSDRAERNGPRIGIFAQRRQAERVER